MWWTGDMYFFFSPVATRAATNSPWFQKHKTEEVKLNAASLYCLSLNCIEFKWNINWYFKEMWCIQDTIFLQLGILFMNGRNENARDQQVDWCSICGDFNLKPVFSGAKRQGSSFTNDLHPYAHLWSCTVGSDRKKIRFFDTSGLNSISSWEGLNDKFTHFAVNCIKRTQVSCSGHLYWAYITKVELNWIILNWKISYTCIFWNENNWQINSRQRTH